MPDHSGSTLKKSLREVMMVHIVEDDPDLRTGLDSLLTSVAIPHRMYETPEEYLKSAIKSGSGCVVLDIRMPGMSGIDLLKAIRQRGIALPIIMMTAHADVPVTIQAFQLGAMEFLLKPFPMNQFLEAVTKAFERDLERMKCETEREQLKTRLDSLSAKDWEVIEMLRQGHPNKRIASELGVTERAVEMRRSALLRRANVTNLPELIELITRHDLQSQKDR